MTQLNQTTRNKQGMDYKVGKYHPPKEYQFKKGESGNPAGRIKGTRNFKTIFKEAAKEVAKALRLGKKPNIVQIELVKRGIKQGLGGSYPFYKDFMDRLYGQPTQPLEHSGEIKEIIELDEKKFRDIARREAGLSQKGGQK